MQPQPGNDFMGDEVFDLMFDEVDEDYLRTDDDDLIEERWDIINKVGQQLDQNRSERAKYARRTFNLTCVWISTVLIIIVASGLSVLAINDSHPILRVSDKVLALLITTTTINVFAFFLLVMKFLFNKQEMSTIEFLFNAQKRSALKNSTGIED